MILKNQKGIALVIAMCTVLFIALSAQLFTFIITQGLHKARKEWNTTSALYIAKAGANLAIRRLQKGDTITSSTTGNLLDGTYNYKSVTDGTDNWITSTGTIKGESQTVLVAYGSITSLSGGAGEHFDYAVFTDGKQEYKGGGVGDTVVHEGKIHSNNKPFDPENTYPEINNDEHKMVEDGYTATSSPDKNFPVLNIRYDSTNPNLNYYASEVELSNNDYWHIATSGGDNHYYHDFLEEKLSPSESSNMTKFPQIPQNGGVTLIIGNSTTDVIEIDSGNGTVIIIGADAKIKGATTFTGFIFVEKNNSGSGGGVLTITGTPTINGTIIARSLDAGAGNLTVNGSASYFDKASVKTDYDPAKVYTFSWQAEY